MHFRNYAKMDPNLLIGLVNTSMRNDLEESDLEGFCKRHDLERELLEKRLQDIGYIYNPEQRQFKPTPKSD